MNQKIVCRYLRLIKRLKYGKNVQFLCEQKENVTEIFE